MRPASAILFALLLFPPLVSSGCHFAEAMGWAKTPDASGVTPGDRLGAAIGAAALNPANPIPWIEIATIGGTFVATAIGGVAVGHAKGKKSALKAAKTG